MVALLAPQLAFADVFVPLHEYLGYFDANEIYTVVGNVKNESDFGVIPTITVSVIDDSKTISKTITHVPVGPGKEIPFKIKFPELSSNTPILVNPEITYEKTVTKEVPIQILYDKTLIKHDDGHITGRIQNTGNEKFSVTLNDEPIEFIQSIDDMGFWHVTFTVESQPQGVLKISGFDKGLPPDYL